MDSKALVAEYARTLPGLKGKVSQVRAPIYSDVLANLGILTTLRKASDRPHELLSCIWVH
jgi:hypothetical protein